MCAQCACVSVSACVNVCVQSMSILGCAHSLRVYMLELVCAHRVCLLTVSVHMCACVRARVSVSVRVYTV